MLSYNDLVNNVPEKDKAEDYLLGFFTKKNLKEYQLDNDLSKDQLKAIKIMFESKKSLRDRVERAFDYDPLCIEAFFVYYLMAEDVYVYRRLDQCYQDHESYYHFDAYQQKCYIIIMNFYVEFCLDINNVTRAIQIQKLMIQLKNKADEKDISRLAFMYFTLENDQDYYRLYLDYDFSLYEYLLLIVTLLKHEEDLKAMEVLQDMYEHIEYSTYIDHAWDLDENDPKQKAVENTVNDVYDDLVSIPNFFSWVNRHRERLSK